MKTQDFLTMLDERFPKSLSAPWDNDGIMYLSPNLTDISRVLVSLDPTLSALNCAKQGNFDLLMTHHPMIFRPVKALCGGSAVQNRIITALREDVSVISLHTRLDAADGGVNDTLADRLGLTVIGKFGDEECEDIGRICAIEEKMTLAELTALVKEKLGCDSVRYTGRKDAVLGTTALCGGDGKSMIAPAMESGADLLITGDAGYNIAEAAAEDGFCVIEAGHWHTEAPVCKTVAKLLREHGIYAEVFEDCPYGNL